MTSLLFLLTVLALFILAIISIIRLLGRRPARKTILVIGLIILVYGLGWIVFKYSEKLVPVPFGTQVCFDDWCATVTKTERQVTGDSTRILLYIEMFNNARGIAQKPSEPRVHILDSLGREWPYSQKGQEEYEKQYGIQPGIGHRLELHQSMETVLVFTIPKNASGLKVIIEEGPWITDLIFPENKQVFLLQ